jgi:meso-butanediol dehydrogenase/(S,S)-butanediol dehydrogenase/diacetyl reductase
MDTHRTCLIPRSREAQLRSFEGQTAVITGGGTGVGAAVALALADAGANITLIGRRLNRLELVAATVRNLGARAACYSADISSGSSVLGVAQRIKAELIHLDILVLNAAMYAAAPFEDADLSA